MVSLIRCLVRRRYVRVAQLDRALGYGPRCREFESSHARFIKKQAGRMSCLFFYASAAADANSGVLFSPAGSVGSQRAVHRTALTFSRTLYKKASRTDVLLVFYASAVADANSGVLFSPVGSVGSQRAVHRTARK